MAFFPLKFIGTLSLGLLTGLSYGLSTLLVPAILSLPAASLAVRSFAAITGSAKVHLRSLSFLSAASFFAAYYLSPRNSRHPYLAYVSLLAAASSLTDLVAPRVPDVIFRLSLPSLFSRLSLLAAQSPRDSSFPAPAAASSATSSSSSASFTQLQASPPPAGAAPVARPQPAAAAAAAHRLEQSYEVLGDAHSDDTEPESPEDAAADGLAAVNGEEVRDSVVTYLKGRVLQTAFTSVGFALAIVGIWGEQFSLLAREEVLICGP